MPTPGGPSAGFPSRTAMSRASPFLRTGAHWPRAIPSQTSSCGIVPAADCGTPSSAGHRERLGRTHTSVRCSFRQTVPGWPPDSDRAPKRLIKSRRRSSRSGTRIPEPNLRIGMLTQTRSADWLSRLTVRESRRHRTTARSSSSTRVWASLKGHGAGRASPRNAPGWLFPRSIQGYSLQMASSLSRSHQTESRSSPG